MTTCQFPKPELTSSKEQAMLIDKQGKVVTLDRKASDAQRAAVREVLEPSKAKSRDFQLGERARVKGVN